MSNITIIRILKYEGNEDWAKKTFEGNGIKPGFGHMDRDGTIEEVWTNAIPSGKVPTREEIVSRIFSSLAVMSSNDRRFILSELNCCNKRKNDFEMEIEEGEEKL